MKSRRLFRKPFFSRGANIPPFRLGGNDSSPAGEFNSKDTALKIPPPFVAALKRNGDKGDRFSPSPQFRAPF